MPMPLLRSRLLAALAYTVFLSVTVFGLSELVLRVGLLPSPEHEHARALRSGTFNVVILGDSFTHADGDWPWHLQHLLRRYFDERGARSLNLGQVGTGPFDYLEALRRYLRYSGGPAPAFVVVDYYVGNDLSDTIWRLRSGTTRVTEGPPDRSWLDRSFFVRYVRRVIALRGTTRETERVRATHADRPDVTNPWILEVARSFPRYVVGNLMIESGEERRAWEENRRALDLISAEVRAIHARMIVNIFPSTAQVNDSHFAFYESIGIATDSRTLSTSVPQDQLLQWCRERGVPCNDLLPRFREIGARESLYWEGDDHWNVAGNRLAFDCIRAFLERERLVPESQVGHDGHTHG